MSELELIQKYFNNKPIQDNGWILLEEFIAIKGELPYSLRQLRLFAGYNNEAFNLIQDYINSNLNKDDSKI
jgi:hypothetical protein